MRAGHLPDNRLARYQFARLAALAGSLATVATLVIVIVLHVLPQSAEVDPLRRTISEYALLGDGWLFDLAVVLLAAGSVTVLASLVAGGVLRAFSAGSAFVLLWSVCLLVLVLFPKHNWAIGPSLHGRIHRVAALVAFLALPIGAMLIGRARRGRAGWDRYASWSFWLGACALLWFLPIIAAAALQPVTGVPWWHAILLGLVERLLALNAIAAMLVLGAWGATTARANAAYGIGTTSLPR